MWLLRHRDVLYVILSIMMKQYWILFTFGALVFFLPFLGFPSSWETAFLFIAGVVISGIAVSFILKERTAHQPRGVHPDDGNPEESR